MAQFIEVLEASASVEERGRYKIVRCDDMRDVKCEIIISANVRTGACRVRVAGEDKDLSLPQRGFWIMSKR